MNAANLLVGNYNIIEHNAYKVLRHGRLNHAFALTGVLCQPHMKPNVHAARKQKSAATVLAPALKKATENRRRAKGSSRSVDQTSTQELALAKPLKQSKIFVSHSLGSSSTDGRGVTQALTCVLGLFNSGSSDSDGEPTNPASPQKRPRKSPIPKIVLKPSEALATKCTLEQFFFLCLS
jgi:hypothetical protein